VIGAIFKRIAGEDIIEQHVAPIRLEHTGDPVLERLQKNLVEALGPLLASPLAGANMFRDVAFSSGVDVVIAHRLGRTFLEAIVCVPSAAARFIRVPQSTDLDAVQVTLRSDATCTASVLIF
jgi:hypothetical protein